MIKKYLIVCTFRTGSSLLAALLHEQTKIVNLDEYILLGPGQEPSLISILIGQESKNLRIYEGLRRQRISYLKQAPSWIVKNPVGPGTTNIEIINHCLDRNDAEVIFLYRKDISMQFLSAVNSTFASTIYKKPKNKYYSNDIPITYDVIDYPTQRIKELAFGTLQRIETWRYLYEQYKKDCKLVCYEDHIESLNLNHIGIEDSTIATYNSREKHLIRTPHITTQIKNDNFENYVDFLESYQYLTNI